VAPATCTFLRGSRDEIVREWEALASNGTCGVALDASALRDELPELLEELARWMEREDPAATAKLCATAAHHAVQRLDHAFQLPQLLREFALLRATILRLSMRPRTERASSQGLEGGAHGEDELVRLNAGLDLAISEAVARFVGERERRIAELGRAEQALRAAEARYGSLVELSPDAILVYRDDRIAFVNPAAQELFGAEARDLLGKSAYDVVRPEDHDLVRERISQLLAGRGRVHRVEVTLVRPDGTTRLAEVDAKSFEDADGRAIEAVLRDVTEQRRAGEALRAAEERLRAHIDNSPLAVIEFDPGFTVTRWSKEAERVFGWTAEEMLGRKIPEVRWVHEEDLESVRRESARLLSGEGKRTLNVNRNYRKDGTVVHCEWYSSALHDSPGRLISILSQVLDVTDRRRAEDALRAADQRKTEFLAVLSHELRNCLAPMRNGLRLLERAPAGSATWERAKGIVGRQIDLVTGLVNDLLDVSRINTGTIRLDRTRLDARDVVRRACEDLRPAFEERGVALEVDVQDGPLWVDADQGRLAQVAGNLLGNALKFTPRGGRVEVTLRRTDGSLELRVRDSGQGIDPRFLDLIFEPFTQPERTPGTSPAGMGIGLSLVRSLVTLHGGTVHAHSEGRGKGAELVVSLPLASAPAQRDEKALSLELPSLAILVIEDNPDAAETLEQLLQMAGHRTRIARDGRSAIEAFREFAPDVVISDVGLPDISGYELIRRIRRLERGRPSFAVALTGYAQGDDVERARAAGFDAHLAKPAPLERLEELLAQAVVASRLEEGTSPAAPRTAGEPPGISPG
jgi:PAS domain S-box-containing protein